MQQQRRAKRSLLFLCFIRRNDEVFRDSNENHCDGKECGESDGMRWSMMWRSQEEVFPDPAN